MYSDLLQRIRDKSSKVGVVGLGYVGLPLAKALVDSGYSCVGFDTDAAKIEQLRQGQSYVGHVDADWLVEAVKAKQFESTTEVSDLSAADVIILCVPTPLDQDRQPDLSFIRGTAQQLAPYLRKGQLILLESTTYPGTTRQVVLPILEQSGLSAGRDFWLAYSPEREDPGNRSYSTRQIPRVVGGLESEGCELAAALFRNVVASVVTVRDCETAEACKLLENVYRAVNIAMVNELKIVFDRLGIDIWEVIAAASTKPFGFQAFSPGPGMGGHCIPVDPFYLSWVARQHGTSARFIELAGEINAQMPSYVLEKTKAALQERGESLRGARVLLLGVAYKKDVDDPRESPAFLLMQEILAAGGVLSYHDPYVPRLPKMRHYEVPELASVSLTAETLANCDVALIVTDHSCVDYALVVQHAPLVVDTRNATQALRAGRSNIVLA